MVNISKDNEYGDMVNVNSDGYMEIKRTDFYDFIGLNYVEFSVEFTVTKEHEIVQTAIYTAVGGVAESIVGGFISNEIQSGLIIEEGDYVSEIILCDKSIGGTRNIYENMETVRVLKYDTDINTDEKFPIEVWSDYRIVYTSFTEGSEVNRIKNEIGL